MRVLLDTRIGMRVLLDTRIGDVDEDEVDTCVSLILNWSNIVIESDSKVCVDALVLEQVSCEWRIKVLCDNVKSLALEFSFCVFCTVAHTLAKLVPLPSSPIVYFSKNLPGPLEEAWFRDFLCLAVSV
jgi:hypothetical protein